MSHNFRIIPLGGLGEIGLNMMLIEYKDRLLIIDAGLMFPEDYMLGVDLVVPSLDYIRSRKADISAIVLTHAHEDHIGALPYLLREVNVPIFATPFTLGMVRQKLEEYNQISSVELKEIKLGLPSQIGPFDVEAIRVNHSVVDGIGLAIRTPLGLIIHTGDFKINHSPVDGMLTDINRFSHCGDEGVLVLMSDSTNAEKEGHTISDKEIGNTLDRIISGCNGRAIVALFASNVGRIRQIVDIAKKIGRKVIFNGRSLDESVRIAKKLGFIDIPKGMEIEVDDIHRYPEENIIIITTGTQGEPMSALARMAAGTHKQIKIGKDDTVILSSTFIPGNEKAIAGIINNLYRNGAEVIYEKISEIHSSGHACQEELRLMLQLTRPRYFIPIHGEYRHLLLHARLAEQNGVAKERILIAENGQVVEFDEIGGRINGTIPTGRMMIDGKGIGDVGMSILKERRTLSRDGFVAVKLAFDEETGYVIYGPEIESKGFVFENETGHLLDDAVCVILEIIEEIRPETTDRIDLIRSRIQTGLKKYFDFTIRRRPLIIPFIMQIRI